MGNALTALSGVPAGVLVDITPRFAVLRDAVAHELVRVGTSLGVNIEPISGRTAAEWLEYEPDTQTAAASTPLQAPAGGDAGPTYPTAWPTSTLQDVIKGRRSEIDYLNGYVSRRGREAGIETPVNDAIVRVLKEVDNHELQPSSANVDRVWDLAYSASGTPSAALA
jgi:2-dehydropantoate 2-reductase